MSTEERDRLVFVIADQQKRIGVLQQKIELLERMVKLGDEQIRQADGRIRTLRQIAQDLRDSFVPNTTEHPAVAAYEAEFPSV